MKIKIEGITVKSNDWKILVANGIEYSANRVSKKGEVFLNFDTLAVGQEVEGELWQSQAGKWYIYPPKPIASSGGASRGFGGGVKAAQERKAEMIEKAQDRKSESIAYFNSVNSAIALVAAVKEGVVAVDDMKVIITYWRDWFLSEWQKYEASDGTDKKQPF